MPSPKKVIVSHAGRQHVYWLIEALNKSEHKVHFYTVLFFRSVPKAVAILPNTIKSFFVREISKRRFSFSRNVRVFTWPVKGFLKELCERVVDFSTKEKLQFWLEVSHDKFVARHISNDDFSCVIGYEISSAETFRAAKGKNMLCILDLAQIHYKTLIAFAEKYSALRKIREHSLFEKINQRKQLEYDLADHIFVISEMMRDSLIDNNVAPQKIHLLNLGFNPQIFSPKKNYTRKPFLKLMYCGALSEQKGLSVLLKAVNSLHDKEVPIQLVLVGPPGDAMPAIRKYERHLSIQLHGYMHHDELVKLYQEADIFVFPSYLDSWGMVVLEAMACGTPVIVTENTGSKDAVRKGGGLIVPTGNRQALADAILQFYDNRSLIQEMGGEAVKVAAEYTWDNYYKQISEIMEFISEAAYSYTKVID